MGDTRGFFKTPQQPKQVEERIASTKIKCAHTAKLAARDHAWVEVVSSVRGQVLFYGCKFSSAQVFNLSQSKIKILHYLRNIM